MQKHWLILCKTWMSFLMIAGSWCKKEREWTPFLSQRMQINSHWDLNGKKKKKRGKENLSWGAYFAVPCGCDQCSELECVFPTTRPVSVCSAQCCEMLLRGEDWALLPKWCFAATRTALVCCELSHSWLEKQVSPSNTFTFISSLGAYLKFTYFAADTFRFLSHTWVIQAVWDESWIKAEWGAHTWVYINAYHQHNSSDKVFYQKVPRTTSEYEINW